MYDPKYGSSLTDHTVVLSRTGGNILKPNSQGMKDACNYNSGSESMAGLSKVMLLGAVGGF